MLKNNYEIIVDEVDYPKVIEVLEYFRINYIDEFSLIQMPDDLDNDSYNRRYGFIGIALAFVGIYLSIMFLFWAQRISYPLNIGGKNLFDFIYSIPVIFEFMVLFVVVGLFLVYIFSNGMFHFSEIHKNKKTIYINNIFSIEPLKEKLKNYNVEIINLNKK